MRQYTELAGDEKIIFDTAVQDAIGEGLIPPATPEELWCDRRCARCGAVVFRELDPGIDYPYYCPMHDENLYGIETTEGWHDE